MDRTSRPSARRTPGFPRRRGDGPFDQRRYWEVQKFPPQARGWTQAVLPFRCPHPVSPAGAGMDPCRARPHTGSAGFPRRRGDGPVVRGIGPPGVRFPPQARGWTVCDAQVIQGPRVSPAGAGMDRSSGALGLQGFGFPRRRGDGPNSSRLPAGIFGFPPQARGWTGSGARTPWRRPVSPAGAGMDLKGKGRARQGRGFPRRRGDGPVMSAAVSRSGRFPPQARGWTYPTQDGFSGGSVSPAGAGMDRRRHRDLWSRGGFPRRRGDGPRPGCRRGPSRGFPPQARGWTPARIGPNSEAAVSPAGAGMDLRHPWARSIRSSFPRRRGDGPSLGPGISRRARFPPQARGWTRNIRWREPSPCVSPAGVGMDRVMRRVPSTGRCFPRRRGDGPLLPVSDERLLGFPPQARGWTGASRRPGLDPPVSPAGAGMDRRRSGKHWNQPRFPRRRGDGPIGLASIASASSFPPQARGWT